MARKYGKLPVKRKTTSKKATSPPAGEAVKFHIRGKDGAPLTMPDVQQGFYQLAKDLEPHTTLRAARVDIYIRFIDEHGRPAGIGRSEVDVHPYKSAADEYGA
jgi:hypothetical protein